MNIRRDAELDSILEHKQGLWKSKQEKFKTIGKSLTQSAKLIDSKQPTRRLFDDFNNDLTIIGLESINNKDLITHCKNLESSLTRLKEQNEKLEEANFELRKRLKEAAINMKKLQ